MLIFNVFIKFFKLTIIFFKYARFKKKTIYSRPLSLIFFHVRVQKKKEIFCDFDTNLVFHVSNTQSSLYSIYQKCDTQKKIRKKELCFHIYKSGLHA